MEKLKTKGQLLINVVGVKIRRAFSELVPGLRLSACIDYVHCVMLGVFQLFLKSNVKMMDDKNETESLSSETCTVNLP